MGIFSTILLSFIFTLFVAALRHEMGRVDQNIDRVISKSVCCRRPQKMAPELIPATQLPTIKLVVTKSANSKKNSEEISEEEQRKKDLERYGDVPVNELEWAVEAELEEMKKPKKPAGPKTQIFYE